MIKSLRATNIYNILNAIPAITGLVVVRAEKPSDEYVRDTIGDNSYLYLSIINDATSTWTDSWTNWGSLYKDAVVSFNIVAWLNKPSTDTNTLFDIIDVINEEIVNEGCSKISDWDWIKVKRVTELSPTPIWYNTKNRAIIVKQYLFTYYAK